MRVEYKQASSSIRRALLQPSLEEDMVLLLFSKILYTRNL
ncbi:hypothetical protein RO3G_04895 [Rhizopus delemar RA 99-880]|uniref:Uncharacterized protein n=1 Tax=Rhizopus delemar (strain RA 99-880 / ATCC MYA-4621 / FGSC 9543 / NRRL 43880) TaxID=246409 RepID=I1BVG0_RHIO9|nr:hypothetical protein RO3G_04895 [Rhizopus delemar RA 99-880]|eukprot:EIE80190.1 hypothetical protein RO3G_04895 [Rhizopus delemar RA 99-880]